MSTGFKIEDGILVKYEGTDSIVVIPEEVKKIGENAFSGNKIITEVTMPDTVVSVGEDAFEECIKLKSVRFSEKLERIESSAFRKCKVLAEAILPETLSYIGYSAFAGCPKLKVISCSSENIQMDSNPFDGFNDVNCKLLYDGNGMLIFAGVLFDYIGENEDVVVPHGVKRIMDNAFAAKGWGVTSNIKSVVLPETVVTVGSRAFATCKKLKKFSAPSGITYGTNAFTECIGLADDSGFIIIDNMALGYFGDAEVVTVPEGVHILSDNLFQVEIYGSNAGNKKISAVNLPSSLKKIGNQVFSGNPSITSIEIPNGVTEIGKSAFNGCSALVTLSLPESVVEIGDSAFQNCTNLKQINIPDTVQKLGSNLFSGCKALADENGFVVNNNTLYAYYGAERNLVIPENIHTIAHYTFNKNGLISIVLPSTLKNLGSAFQGCEMLEEIIIPEGVEVIYDHTFTGCIRLTKVVLPSTITQIGSGAFKGCEALSEFELPQNVRHIGSYAFENCSSIKKLSLTNVSNIEYQSFKGCSQLETISLSNELKVIGASAFENCSSLTSVEIPTSVSEIQYSAFENCTSLKEIKMSDASNVTMNITSFANCPSLADKDGFTIIGGILWFYSGKGGDVAVPEGVLQIAPNAFREGEEYSRRSWKQYRKEGSLHSISLPKSLKKIYNNAFAGCIKLTEIVLPENLEAIEEYAFNECKALKSIVVPDSVTSLGQGIFTECKLLEDITIGSGVKVLPSYIFKGCSSLRTINIPKNIEVICIDAFSECNKLLKINVDTENTHYSDEEGVLFNKDATELVFCPCGTKRTEYVVSNSVVSISSHAFIDCLSLKKIVIPETVASVGDEVFPRNDWNNKLKLTDIEVSPMAGSKQIGSEVFSFPYGDDPLVYPKLPVSFVKESTIQVRLGMGYCQHPEQFEGECAEIYKKYVASHEKTIVKKAKQLKLTDVEAYYTSSGKAKDGQKAAFKPNVSAKKLSDLAKVELLEDTVQKGTIDDLKLVIQTYKTFEMMSRALGIAARYRGLEFVKELVDAGATFRYEFSTTLQRKYKMNQDTAAGSYRTEYYLMLVPEKLDFRPDNWGGSKYSYTPLCGVPAMNIPDELENNVLSVEERFEIAKFCSEQKKLKVSLDEMLFWALTRSELKFADLLIEHGVNLNSTAPAYYTSWGSYSSTYMDIITTGSSSLYWNEYVYRLTELKSSEVLPVLERFNKLAVAAGKKLVISQKMFDEVSWSDKSLAFALENIDFAKANQKKALEFAVDKNFIAALECMAQMGWLSTTAKREKLIEYARTNKKKEALAWLMDFKNRTVDVQAEAAKEEAKLIKELTEDPNSVSALKKIWSYKKLDDGTLIITSYKGDATEVEVPAVIGKAAVTVIGEDSFSASDWNGRIKNKAERKKIKSITIPEGVVEIQKHAFWNLDELEKLILPSTIKKIGTAMAGDCKKLKDVNIPAGVELVGDHILFVRCNELHDKDGCIIINGCLYTHTENNGWAHGFGVKSDIGNIAIPEGVTKIAGHVFYDGRMSSVTFPSGLTTIGENAFEKCTFLSEVEIPGCVVTIKSRAFSTCPALKTVKMESGVSTIGAEAFAQCKNLRDVYIPRSVKKLGKEIFGAYDDNPSAWNKVTGIYVHTQEDSPVVEYMKKYEGVYVVFDYDE